MSSKSSGLSSCGKSEYEGRGGVLLTVGGADLIIKGSSSSCSFERIPRLLSLATGVKILPSTVLLREPEKYDFDELDFCGELKQFPLAVLLSTVKRISNSRE